MFRTLLAHLLLAMVLGAPLSAQVRPADTLDSSRRCLFTRGRGESTSEFLRRCAEEFVARNGYTSAPPTADSTLWSPESIEFASSWQEVFQRRHNVLMPKAEVLAAIGSVAQRRSGMRIRRFGASYAW
jgi:hypothetical protein